MIKITPTAFFTQNHSSGTFIARAWSWWVMVFSKETSVSQLKNSVVFHPQGTIIHLPDLVVILNSMILFYGLM